MLRQVAATALALLSAGTFVHAQASRAPGQPKASISDPRYSLCGGWNNA